MTRARASRLVGALVAAAVLTGSLAGCGPATPTNDVVGQDYQSGDGSMTQWAPGKRKGPVELAGADFTGQRQDTAQWRGDVVVLNTWYASCPPCRAEAPDLAAVANDYAARGVHVLGVNSTDEAGAALAFMEKFAIPFPSIADSDGSAVAALQGVVPVNAVPTTVVLDRDGKVAARVLGLIEESTLRAVLDDVLAEPA